MSTAVRSYYAVRGKLAPDDAREAYVMGPDLNGRMCPVASFWRFEDAERWAEERNAQVALAAKVAER